VTKRERRAEVLCEACSRHPERFPNGPPEARPLPTAVWINPPAKLADASRPENTMTQESRNLVIVDPGASCEADLEAEGRESPILMPEEVYMTAVQQLREPVFQAADKLRLGGSMKISRDRPSHASSPGESIGSNPRHNRPVPSR